MGESILCVRGGYAAFHKLLWWHCGTGERGRCGVDVAYWVIGLIRSGHCTASTSSGLVRCLIFWTTVWYESVISYHKTCAVQADITEYLTKTQNSARIVFVLQHFMVDLFVCFWCLLFKYRHWIHSTHLRVFLYSFCCHWAAAISYSLTYLYVSHFCRTFVESIFCKVFTFYAFSENCFCSSINGFCSRAICCLLNIHAHFSSCWGRRKM